MTKKKEPASYQDALHRIEEIIEQIDASEQDVDALGPLVEEAAMLLTWCKGRLEQTRLRVDAALENIEDAPDDEHA